MKSRDSVRIKSRDSVRIRVRDSNAKYPWNQVGQSRSSVRVQRWDLRQGQGHREQRDVPASTRWNIHSSAGRVGVRGRVY